MGACKKDGDRLFSRACYRRNGDGFKLKENRFKLDKKKKFFTVEGGKELGQVAHRGGRCHIHVNTLCQARWGSKQPDVVEDVPGHCKGVRTDDL